MIDFKSLLEFMMTYLPFIALFVTICFFFYPRIEAYYKERPKLIVRLEHSHPFPVTQTPKGLSSKNGLISQGADEDWYIYEYEWNFNLLIINSSEFNASQIKLFQNKQKSKLDFQETIDFDRALLAHNEKVLSFRIVFIVEIQGKEREDYFENAPSIFKDLNILLEYKSPKGRKVYSNYDFRTNETSFDKPKDLKVNWVNS